MIYTARKRWVAWCSRFSDEQSERMLIVGLVITVLFVFMLIASQYDSMTQLYLAYAIIALLFILGRFFDRSNYYKIFFLLLGLFVTLRYMYWRTTASLGYEGFFDFLGSIILYSAEFYSVIIYVLGIFTSLMPLNRRIIDIRDRHPDELPTVDVFIPTYNEPITMVEDTTMAAMAFEYPRDRFNVYILDDGGSDQKCNDANPAKAAEAKARRKAFTEFSEKMGSGYIIRPRNLHAKAGNLNEAMQKTDGELILILDCDHIPTKDFLQNTVGWFIKEPKMFLVQTPHMFYNPDPVEKNLGLFKDIPSENEMFYKQIQKGHDFWDSSFFCGSAALLRRKYLDEVGGIAGETITEDAETALSLHGKGYKSAYIAEPMVRGLQADTLAGLVLQRIRWTQGMIQIFILKNPLRQKGLKWYQKMSYLSASVFWFFSYSRMVFLIAPFFFIFFGLRIYRADDIELLAYTVPHIIVAFMISYRLYGDVRWTFFSELYETLLSLFTLPATLEVIRRPRDPEFAVTPKGEDLSKDFVSHLVTPFVIFLGVIMIAFAFSIYRLFIHPEDWGVIIMTTVWNLFNFFLILAAIAISNEKKQQRQYIRVPSNENIILRVGHETYHGVIRDMSMGGIAIGFNEHVLKDVREANLKRNSKVSLLIYDIDGNLTTVDSTYLRGMGDRLIFRFSDIETNIELRKKMVNLLFGENTRWVIQEQRERHLSPFAGLAVIIQHTLRNVWLMMSVKAAYRNIVQPLFAKGK